MILFFVTVIIITALIIIPIQIKNKKRKRESLEKYIDFISKNGMKNCQSVSFNDIVRLDIDTKNKLLGAYNYLGSKSYILKFSEVLDFEIFENGSSVVSSRSGSAIAGGLLFGGLGAVAGASGSRKIGETCDTLKLRIYTNSVENSVITLDFLESSISKTGITKVVYEQLNDIVNKMISFLKIAREDNRQKERKEDKSVVVENVDEVKSSSNLSSLKELAELKEKGIITEKEFEESKKKILAKL